MSAEKERKMHYPVQSRVNELSGYDIVDGHGYTVASMVPKVARDDIAQRLNAHDELVSALEENLADLRQLGVLIDEIDGDGPRSTISSLLEALTDRTSAALAKASPPAATGTV